MNKYILMLILTGVSISAQTPGVSSPRRMWTGTPDDITNVLIARAEKHIADGNIAKSEEAMETIRIIHANTLMTDEGAPDNTRVLRFTPQYLIAQFKGIAGALENLIKGPPIMRAEQAQEIALQASIYRNAAALIETNSVPKPDVKH
jgi:hypothetical protein